MVYEAAAARGISPAEVDACEIWVLASALGANNPDEDAAEAAGPDGLSWNERRALALARGEPEPQWDDVPPPVAEQNAMRLLMAQVT